jgi:prepilin-type N-terminal cleavage/methylation domain-containing protein
MSGRANEPSRSAGFTLLELMVSVTLISAVLLAIALTTRTATQSYEEGRHQDELGSRTWRALDRVAREFSDAGRDGLDPEPAAPLGSTVLSFRKSDGYADGSMDWGPVSRVFLALEAGEVANGADDNGNGLVDESNLVLIERIGLADEREVVLARGVAPLLGGEVLNNADDNGNGLQDEEGLSFVLNGDVLTIRLTLLAVDRDGDVRSKTAETSVRVRN